MDNAHARHDSLCKTGRSTGYYCPDNTAFLPDCLSALVIEQAAINKPVTDQALVKQGIAKIRLHVMEQYYKNVRMVDCLQSEDHRTYPCLLPYSFHLSH